MIDTEPDDGLQTDSDAELVAVVTLLEPMRTLQTMHYLRNALNHPEAGDATVVANDWVETEPALYHKHECGNEGNRKYLSPDGHSEAVLRADGTIDTSDKNQGTYNIGTHPSSHFLFDMLPYYAWGNTPNDSTSIFNRVLGPNPWRNCSEDD